MYVKATQLKLISKKKKERNQTEEYSIDLTKFLSDARNTARKTLLSFLLNILESAMKDFSCTQPLGNCEDLLKIV